MLQRGALLDIIERKLDDMSCSYVYSTIIEHKAYHFISKLMDIIQLIIFDLNQLGV